MGLKVVNFGAFSELLDLLMQTPCSSLVSYHSWWRETVNHRPPYLRFTTRAGLAILCWMPTPKHLLISCQFSARGYALSWCLERVSLHTTGFLPPLRGLDYHNAINVWWIMSDFCCQAADTCWRSGFDQRHIERGVYCVSRRSRLTLYCKDFFLGWEIPY